MVRQATLLVVLGIALSLLLFACSSEDEDPPPPTIVMTPGIPNGSASVDREPLLFWRAQGDLGRLGGYQVRLDTLTPPRQTFAAGRDTFWQAPRLSALNRYYWDVAAVDTGGAVIERSSVWSFTTAFVLTGIEPPDGAVDVPTTAILRWSPNKQLESRVTSYIVRFGTDPDWLELLYEGTETWLIQGGLEPGTTYWWYVTAVDTDGVAHPDGPWSFTVGFTSANQPLITVALDGEAFAEIDTVGYGRPFELTWIATTPNVDLFSPEVVAALDTLPPLDGIVGYQYAAQYGGELVWRPRRYDEASGDSVATFGGVTELTFANDDSGDQLFGRRLESGVLELGFNAVDLAGIEVPEETRPRRLVVNFDPDSRLLRGETDPYFDDPVTYPYYEVFHGPEAGIYSFDPNDDVPDTIPDRARVVLKAVGQDDPRDLLVGDTNELGFQGRFRARQRFLGGAWYEFGPNYSEPHQTGEWTESWPGGMASDTLSFLTGPFEYAVTMRTVDEHDRRDGTPDTLSFVGNHPPCVQCIELVNTRQDLHPPQATYQSPCLDTACLGPTATLTATPAPDPTNPQHLLQEGTGFVWANPVTGDVTFEEPLDWSGYTLIEVAFFEMMVYLSGKDHPLEYWPPGEAYQRIKAWRYQVDYEADPDNQFTDGAGIDDITAVTGFDVTQNDTTSALFIKSSGTWGMKVRVGVPLLLLEEGPQSHWDLLLASAGAPPYDPGDPTWFEDPAVLTARRLWDLTTLQFSPGTVSTVAQDITTCNFMQEAGMYHYFEGVRVPEEHGRRCEPGVYDTVEIQAAGTVYLEDFAPESLSHGGEPVMKRFQIEVHHGGANPGVFVHGDPPGWR